MNCKKCQGRVFYDNTYSDNTFLELYCIMCGKRKMVSKTGSVLGKWLSEKILKSELALR